MTIVFKNYKRREYYTEHQWWIKEDDVVISVITPVTKGITYTYKHIDNTRVFTSLVEPFTKIIYGYLLCSVMYR